VRGDSALFDFLLHVSLPKFGQISKEEVVLPFCTQSLDVISVVKIVKRRMPAYDRVPDSLVGQHLVASKSREILQESSTATAFIILVQANLLRQQNQQAVEIAKKDNKRASKIASRQNQLHALIELQKEWDSERMLKLRSAWAAKESDIERLEPDGA